ncbi:hypothetical protein [Pectobacterium polaris]|uniref:hypothetical protein n=1 Tax=Pectobacterium polaris TaxID=2042057 RepID=UPI0035C26962
MKQAVGYDIGKTSRAGRDYLSGPLDEPSFAATVYACLIEGYDLTIYGRLRCYKYWFDTVCDHISGVISGLIYPRHDVI